MMQHISAKKRQFNDMGWLQTYWLFSFGDYYDANNVSHGAIRVFNDDIVQPHSGFGKHPHTDMEIISVVLYGEMEHQDDMGNIVTLKENDVQRMTAGTGVYHSEWNKSDSPVAFFQIWILPDAKGDSPSYDQKNFDPQSWQNRLKLLASQGSSASGVTLNTDAELYRARLDAGIKLDYSPKKSRAQFLYVIEGEIEINNHMCKARDQLRVSKESHLNLKAASEAEILLVDTKLI